MKIDHDAVSDMGYISLSDNEVDKTFSYGRVNIDVDAEGNAVGIELFDFSEIIKCFKVKDGANDN